MIELEVPIAAAPSSSQGSSSFGEFDAWDAQIAEAAKGAPPVVPPAKRRRKTGKVADAERPGIMWKVHEYMQQSAVLCRS